MKKKSEMNVLRATKEDLRRAVRDALYAQRLKERGLSPLKLFIELNEIARKIRVASEASQTSQTKQRRRRRTRRKKRIGQTGKQTRPQIPNKKSPTSRRTHNTTNHPNGLDINLVLMPYMPWPDT